MCVDVHGKDGLCVIEDTFLQHMVPASMTLLRRLEDELHRALLG
jgi:hypothetical protein